MALVANYSSSGESDEESVPTAAVPSVPVASPAAPAADVDGDERRRKRRAPKRSGPTLAEKRRMLMAAPVAVPDSDSEDEPGPTAAPPPIAAPTSITAMLPQPLNSRGTAAGHSLHVSAAQMSANMPSDKFIEAKGDASAGISRSLVPHVLGKKKKSEKKVAHGSEATVTPAPTAAYPPARSTFSMMSTVDAAPGAPSASGPSTAAKPAFGYGQSAVAATEYSAAPVAKSTGSFGYGKAPVPVSMAGGEGSAAVGAAPGPFQDVDVHDESFQQLLGADQRQRSKHGRNAGIKFVDVDKSATVGSFDEWHRQYGHVQPEAKAGTANTAKLSSNDKRKHQITWLAAQAKDQQQMLEQHWAQGAAAKRAARQRYGFN